MTDLALLQKKARFGRLATVALLALLMAFMAVEAMLEPLAPAPMLFLIAVLLLPLSFFLVPAWHGRVQSAIWLCLFLMPYFCWAVLGSFVPGTDGRLALARCLIIAACFTAAMLMARWQRAADASANP
ncbi:MAG: putative rane protein [Moraxellaceae bacterium]|jgi:uncharacterized membrane protein|nr:putative rane protein [Moraxellaceae bacterium]